MVARFGLVWFGNSHHNPVHDVKENVQNWRLGGIPLHFGPLRWGSLDLNFVPSMLAFSLTSVIAGGTNAQEVMPDAPVGQTIAHCPDTGGEKLTGTESSDFIFVENSNTCVVTKAGDDTVKIEMQSNQIFVLAGQGDDTVFVGPFANDVQVAAGSGQDDVILGLKAATVWGQGGDDAIRGSTSDDRLDGGPGNDQISGGWGDDLLVGASGDDILEGENGSDRLFGGAGDDVIKADAPLSLWFGDDYIMPGPGKDLVLAGGGDDTVVLYDLCEVEAGEELYGGLGTDTLVSPVSLAVLEAAGVSVHGFEQFSIEQNSCASDCIAKPDCNGRGVCAEGPSSGQVICNCEERYAGDDCSECGVRFAGDDCETCSERYQGENCEQCRPPFTGENCLECEAPWRGPNCDQCPGRRTGPTCESCAYPFTGPDCELCVSPHAGPECKTCTNGMMGDGCDECDPDGQNQCSGIADCLPIGDSGAGRCDCPSGRVGPDCSESVQELSIQWNEPPSTFELHRLPAGDEIGERSAAWLLPIVLEETASGCVYTREIPVDKKGLVAIAASSGAADNVWEIEVSAPDGEAIALADSRTSPPDEQWGSQRSVVFTAPSEGLYRVRVAAPGRSCAEIPTTQGEMQVLVEESEQVLYTNIRGLQTYRGNAVVLEVRMIDKAASPVSSEPYEPEALTGAIFSAQVTDTQTGIAWDLVDDGTQGDRVAGDGIYSKPMPMLYKGVLEWQIEVNRDSVMGTAARSQTMRLNVVERALAVDQSKEAFLGDPGDPVSPGDFEPIPSEDLGRFPIRVPIKAVGLEIPETDSEWDRFRLNEYVVSAELYGIEQDGREFPIAWISGIELPQGFDEAPLYSSVSNDGFFLLEVDHRWFTNIRVLNNVDFETMRFELRRLRVVDRKSSVLIDVQDRNITVDTNDYRRWLLQTVDVQRVFDTDTPEFEEMIKGAESDFVAEIEKNVTAVSFPKLRGNVLLVAGYCGRADDRWQRDTMLDLELDMPGGNKLRDRVINFDPWFGRLNGGNASAVSVSKFSDELSKQLGPNADAEMKKVAQIWAMSQGGIAAVDMHSRHNSLHAYKKQMKAKYLPPIHVAASAFLGTPLASMSPVALLSRVGSWITRGCTPDRWWAVSSGLDFISYGHIASGIRNANTPWFVRKDVEYGRVRHGNDFLRIKSVCSFLVSRFFLVGDDDGLVQSEAATLGGATVNEAMDNVEEFCHAENKFANMYWDWMLDDKKGLKWSFCQRSFLPELNPNLDCFYGQKAQD